MLNFASADSAALVDAASARRLVWAASAMFAVSVATILGALGFEHIGGYLPCALCLMQRTPYYIGVPIAAVTLVAVWLNAPRPAVVLLFAVFAALMLYGAGLGAYHSGVEWGIWEGPAACAPSVGVSTAAEMLDQLQNAHAPSCTDAACVVAAIFAGAALYVSAVEHPARAVLDDKSQLRQWKPAYKRGFAMQAPLAIVGFLLGLLAWWSTGDALWALGAAILVANWPYTLLVILPTNNRLMATEPTAAGPESRLLLDKWGALHAGRTALGLVATIVFLWGSMR
jgi:disulfide bond formation protein DsbB